MATTARLTEAATSTPPHATIVLGCQGRIANVPITETNATMPIPINPTSVVVLSHGPKSVTMVHPAAAAHEAMAAENSILAVGSVKSAKGGVFIDLRVSVCGSRRGQFE
jgi:hypothetical protein